MNNKEIAASIYAKHLALASVDGRNFRKTVMDEIMVTANCSLSASATYYNNCKKESAPIEGLGRAPVSKNVRKPGSKDSKNQVILQDDDECYTVIELLMHTNGSATVGRCCSHLLQGDASEEFDERVEHNPPNIWVMIKGLGPNHGDNFKIAANEIEIKRYTPAVVAVTENTKIAAIIDELDEDEEKFNEEVEAF